MEKKKEKPTKKYLKVSDEELAKLAKYKADKSGQSVEVDPEWLEISEFGGYYGYAGVEAILSNKIDRDVVQMLIAGQRKVIAGQMADIAYAMFIGSVSSRQKRPSGVFKKAVKVFIDRMKVKT